jgi:hypothetical protein
MIKTPLIRTVLFATALAWIFVGCVDIPSEGHTPPDYKAEVRVLYLDPMITGTASIVMAPGPDFTSFSSTGLPSGTFGSPISAYSVLDAGAKRIFLSPGDADTSVITFAVELRGTLFILPRPDVANSRFLFASERYTFATNGIPDSGRVRFLNAIYRGSAATEDIAVM